MWGNFIEDCRGLNAFVQGDLDSWEQAEFTSDPEPPNQVNSTTAARTIWSNLLRHRVGSLASQRDKLLNL
jgi:hypothetical protein